MLKKCRLRHFVQFEQFWLSASWEVKLVNIDLRSLVIAADVDVSSQLVQLVAKATVVYVKIHQVATFAAGFLCLSCSLSSRGSEQELAKKSRQTTTGQ